MNALDGSSKKRLTSNAAVDTNPAFSPDDKKIAFTSTRSGNYEIHVMNARDGSNTQNRTKNGEFDSAPDWGVATQ
jgi:TolB protein